MTTVSTTQLRSRFAARLSVLYGEEVPLYRTLVEVSHEVNSRVLAGDPTEAERLGSISRVTAERHGAIRVGSPSELRQVARIFAALGMQPTGFYDLRAASPQRIPVVSTAFRPLARDELATNPFRVFTSMLVPEDRRFFDAEISEQIRAFVASRTLFPPELLALADRASAHGELDEAEAQSFLDLSAQALALSARPVDRAWYERLQRISGVAADIGGVSSTHINHLTPRVLDIDDLYTTMQARGVDMIDTIQGPPAWHGPAVLLRQTSFRALSEPRTFLEPDGSTSQGALRVRFGEVEARGVALTPAGRDLYDVLISEVDRRLAAGPTSTRQEVASGVWSENMPDSDIELWRRGLAFYSLSIDRERRPSGPITTLEDAVRSGLVRLEPIVYEDFLPRSAAGIFSSNLVAPTSVDEDQEIQHVDARWLANALEQDIHVPEDLYAAEADASASAVCLAVGLPE